MSTRAAGTDMRADVERTPQVQKQLEALRLVVERINQGITEATKVFRPVLAEVGGEQPVPKTDPVLECLAPLAEDLANLEDRLDEEAKRLYNLVCRCEV